MKRRVNVKVIIVIVCIVIALILLVKKRRSDLASLPPARVTPAVVSVKELRPEQVTLTLPAVAVVASDVSTVLSTKVSGQVLTVTKREGETVKKGEVLARIDVADLEAKRQGLIFQRQGVIAQIQAKKSEVQAFETSLKTALDSHKRTKELLDVKGASPEQYSQEEAEIARIKAGLAASQKTVETLQKTVETLDSSIKEIENQISYATIVAPIDGRIAQILARPGDLATPGKPLIKLSSKAGLYLNVSLPDSVKAEAVLLKGEYLPLTPKDQTSETGLIQYVSILPQNSGFVEGQFVSVNVVLWRGEGILVPLDALLTVGNSTSVFVMNEKGKAERRTVTIKARGVEGVIVNEDLSGSKVLVAKPDILLRVASGVPVVVTAGL